MGTKAPKTTTVCFILCVSRYIVMLSKATERQVWRRRKTKRSTHMRGNWYGPNGPTEEEHSHGPGHGGRGGHGRSRGGGGGGWGGPPWAGHRGDRRTRRGEIRTGLLPILLEGPGHGYELIQRIE